MKKILITIIILIGVVLSATAQKLPFTANNIWAKDSLSAFNLNNIYVKQAHEIYTLGNSLTSAGTYQSRLSTLLPINTWTITNFGIEGTTTTQMLDRLDNLNNGAEYVIMWGGINDVTQSVYLTVLLIMPGVMEIPYITDMKSNLELMKV